MSIRFFLRKSRSLFILNKLFNHLSFRRKKQLYLLLILNLIIAFAESISLGMLFPFLSILLDPLSQEYPLIIYIVRFFPLESSNVILVFITLSFITLIIISNGLRIAGLWSNGRMAAAIGSDFSHKCLKKILYSSYSEHLLMDSNKNLSTMTIHLNTTVIAINAFLKLITSAVISLAIIIFLFMFNFTAAFSAIFMLVISYGFIAKIVRKRLKNNSKFIANSTKSEISILKESFNFIKDLILDFSQPRYLSSFKSIDINMRRLQVENIFLGVSPRYIMEVMGFVFIASLALYLSFTLEQPQNSIPILGTIALGAQRLLPSLQQIYNSWSQIGYYNTDMLNVLSILETKQNITDESRIYNKVLNNSYTFKNNIRFENVYFSYSDDAHMVLNDLSFSINKGERVGIIGSTGSGKSTLLDLLLSILTPTKGNIFIDDVNLHSINQISNWRQIIAHVPQSIFLLNDSISTNISLEKVTSHDELSLINSSAEAANLIDYVNSLDNKLETYVGENGIKLSGGQRQRIGIARALFKNPQVLLLDEATSALDIHTEKKIIKSIAQLSRDITVIIVAHRLSTIKTCDRIFQLEGGKLVAIGTPDEILKSYH